MCTDVMLMHTDILNLLFINIILLVNSDSVALHICKSLLDTKIGFVKGATGASCRMCQTINGILSQDTDTIDSCPL